MEKLKTIEIQGKPYVTVNVRIQAFRKDWPEGQIITRIITSTDNAAQRVKCLIYLKQEDKRPVAVGHSEEYRSEKGIFADSIIEVAETSAIGRALGVLGYGIDEAVASGDEMIVKTSKAPKVAKLMARDGSGELKSGHKNGKEWYAVFGNEGPRWLKKEEYLELLPEVEDMPKPELNDLDF